MRVSKAAIFITLAMMVVMFYALVVNSFGRKYKELVHTVEASQEGSYIGTKTLPQLKQYRDGKFRNTVDLKGIVFSGDTEMGSRKDEFGSEITISVIKSLSESVLTHVRQIFNDDHGENIYYATIPAIIKRGNTIEVVQRIWLGQYEKMKTKYKRNGMGLETMFNEWHNTWQENHFYHMTLDEHYNLLKPGEIMGIPTTTNVKFTYKSDGLMDPRLAQVGDKCFLVFHTWLIDKNSNNEIGGRVHIWDMDNHVKVRLWPHMKLQRTEINWIPLDIKGELYMTYSIDPLRVMRCNHEDGNCHFIYEQEGSSGAEFQYSSDHLRGGTPWIEYRYPYYISMAHNVASTYRPMQDFAIYNVNLVVLNVETWRVVYVSENIQTNKKWLDSEPVIRNHTIIDPFWYPTGIILQSDDIIDVSCHLNDASGHILRMRGIKNIIGEAINRDSKNTDNKGPKVRVVQQYVLESTKETHKKWSFLGDIINHTVEGVDLIS